MEAWEWVLAALALGVGAYIIYMSSQPPDKRGRR